MHFNKMLGKANALAPAKLIKRKVRRGGEGDRDAER